MLSRPHFTDSLKLLKIPEATPGNFVITVQQKNENVKDKLVILNANSYYLG